MLKSKEKWWVLCVTTTATSLFLLDTTILPVALPTIEQQLGFTAAGSLWILNAYLLALTACLLIGGKLCEIFGFRTLFNAGLALFGCGAALAALSQTPSLLITARIAQGVGSALAFPATASLLIATFPPQLRARALGIDTGIASLFMIAGPILGGTFAQFFSWRLIFLFYLPFVFFGIAMSCRLLKRSKVRKAPFPLFSSLLMIFGVVLFVTGVMEGSEAGWKSPWVLSATFGGIALMFLFVVTSLRTLSPLCDFALFKHPLFLGAITTRFLAYFIITASVLWIVYFEKVLHYTPAQIGAFVVSASLPVIALAPIGGVVADKFWYRLPLVGGFALLLLGLVWMAAFAWAKNLWVYLPGFCAFGIALPFVMAPTLALGLSTVPSAQLGSAAGVMMAVRQLASTTGIALMTALYYSVERTSGSADPAFLATALFSLLLAACALFLSFLFIRKRYLPQEKLEV